MQLTARICPEEGGFVAECVELKVMTEGDTEDAALSNLREAVDGFLACADPSEVRERFRITGSHAAASTRSAAARALRTETRIGRPIRCVYDNTGDNAGRRLRFGDSSQTDETCMQTGYYFPATKPQLCVNDSIIN